MLPLLLAREMRDAAAATARMLFADGQPPLTPGMALRALEITRSLEPAVALRAARLALESPDLHEAKRARAEALIAELSGAAAAGTSPGAPGPRPSAVPPAASASDPAARQPPRAAPARESRAIEIEPDLEGEALLAAARQASREAAGYQAPQALDASGALERGEDADDLLPVELHEGRATDLDAGDGGGLELGEPLDLSVDLDGMEAVLLEAEAQGADAAGRPIDDPGEMQFALGEAFGPDLALPDPMDPEAAESAQGTGDAEPDGPPRTAAPRPCERASRSDCAADGEPEVHAAARAAAERVPRFSGLKVLEASPVAIDDGALDLVQPGGKRARLPLARIQAIAVAAVRGMGPKPVLVIDLAANWLSLDDETLRIVRLRSDRFDPTALFPEAGGSLAAMRMLLEAMLGRSAAVPLPAREAALGRPFAHFDDLASYERAVLEVDA
jgi:hypothetical protein